MAGTLSRIAGPAYIANAAANIYTPPAAIIYLELQHIHIANRTNTAVTFSLYVGATGGSAAGTELIGTRTVAPYDTFDYYCRQKMVSTDFLSGVASAASSLVIIVEGEQFVV